MIAELAYTMLHNRIGGCALMNTQLDCRGGAQASICNEREKHPAQSVRCRVAVHGVWLPPLKCPWREDPLWTFCEVHCEVQFLGKTTLLLQSQTAHYKMATKFSHLICLQLAMGPPAPSISREVSFPTMPLPCFLWHYLGTLKRRNTWKRSTHITGYIS